MFCVNAFIGICKVLYSLCLLCSYGNCYKVLFNNSNEGNDFLMIFHRLKNKNHEFTNNIFKGRIIMNVSREKEYANLSDCMSMYICVNRTCNQDLESLEIYDTLTQSDIVRNQYMTLPYPAVSDRQLEMDKSYYENLYKIRKTPYVTSYGITFEALNHFLYKGRNTFR